MERVTKFCCILFILGYLYKTCNGLSCYTCTVDFRSDEFSVNDTCIFPKDHDDLAHCSHNSKYCKAIVTRVGGVFVMLQRSCADVCEESCSEKGYGVRIQDCTICCTKENDCGASALIKKK